MPRVWKENNNANKFAPATAELYRSAFTLRQRMMSAVQNIEYYMMIEVIEPTWHEFVAKLDAVSNVDEVLLVHQDFLDDCLYNCMLKTPELLRAVTKLCNICLAFCKFIQVRKCFFMCEICIIPKRSNKIYPFPNFLLCCSHFMCVFVCMWNILVMLCSG